MDMEVFWRKNAEIRGAHKIGAAISGPRIAHKNFTDTRIFLNLRVRSSTAKLRIWTLRIGVFGAQDSVLRDVDASRLFLDHFPKHLSSVLGWTSALSRGPDSRAPKTPNHPQRKPPSL